MAPLHGWQPLPDGREGFYIDGTCCAAIAHHPERATPFATDSVTPTGVRELRNLDTRADAMEQCERGHRLSQGAAVSASIGCSNAA